MKLKFASPALKFFQQFYSNQNNKELYGQSKLKSIVLTLKSDYVEPAIIEGKPASIYQTLGVADMYTEPVPFKFDWVHIILILAGVLFFILTAIGIFFCRRRWMSNKDSKYQSKVPAFPDEEIGFSSPKVTITMEEGC